MINYKIKNNMDTYELYFNEILSAISNVIEKLLAYIYFVYLENIHADKNINIKIDIEENKVLAFNIQNNINMLKNNYDKHKDQLISIWAGVNIPDWFK